MSVLLCAINAKYSHTALGVRSLAAYANHPQVSIAEYTINQLPDAILRDMFRRGPRAIGFSCYIWNIGLVLDLAAKVKKILPDCQVFLGGPEVSYEAETLLADHPAVDFIIQGEGELPFKRFVHGAPLEEIPGILTRRFQNPPSAPVPLEDIPFVYQDLEGLSHKILYYETQRGCPFSCQYCLSSVEAGIRFLPWERVDRDLQFFLDQRVRQVKFIDRTFNCNPKHAMHIWQYLIDHDNGTTNFHMELAAHLLHPEMLDLLSRARKGLFQFEIGVQSTHPPTLAAIRRAGDFSEIARAVVGIKGLGNIHQHLDLIAGLPYEGYGDFAKSFDDVYALGMEQLQLGFLKLLKGSGLRQMAEVYGIRYSDSAPYEVLSTPQLPYADLLRLKNIEEMVETYYNSGKALYTLDYAVKQYQSPFRLYEAMGDYWDQNGLFEKQHNKEGLFTNLYDFCRLDPVLSPHMSMLLDCLQLDMHTGDRLNHLPPWLPQEESPDFKQKKRAFYQNPERVAKYLPHLAGCTPAQRNRMCQIVSLEHFGDLLFDYHAPGGTRVHRLEEGL